LERQYDEDAFRVTLGIEPAPNGDTYEFLIARGGPGPRYAEELQGTVDFGHGPIRAWLLNYGTKDPVFNILKFRIRADDMAQARFATSVTFHLDGRVAGRQDVTFALRALPGVLSGLEQCTEMLRHYWNMTPKEANVIARPPRGDLRPLFSADDYPAEAVKHDQEGSAQYLLLINEKGSVSGCHVVKPSGVPVLDAMGCQVFRQRAKFAPALDAKGTPVRIAVTTPPVVWSLR
jgi:TonB family protein